MNNLFAQPRCLICHEPIRQQVGWGTLFSIEKEQLICGDCEGQFEKIQGEVCKICSRPLGQLAERFRQDDVCHDCTRWESNKEWQGSLLKNNSIYLYNDFLKVVLAKYKFRGDYVLAKIFVDSFKILLAQKTYDYLVPIPLSDERLYERGFNQAEAFVVESGLTPSHLLSRIHSEKQSKKSRIERMEIAQVFRLKGDIDLTGKVVVLIDDIYTTGSTLRHAAKVLKQAGANRIESVTIAR